MGPDWFQEKVVYMNDIEYLGKVTFNRLTSLEEDSKSQQAQFYKDEQARKLRRSGIIKQENTPTTYERFPEEE